jgi:hypothetical protein
VLRLNEADAKALIRNVSSSDQERALVDKIKQMDRFKALYFCKGNKRATYLSLPREGRHFLRSDRFYAVIEFRNGSTSRSGLPELYRADLKLSNLLAG